MALGIDLSLHATESRPCSARSWGVSNIRYGNLPETPKGDVYDGNDDYDRVVMESYCVCSFFPLKTLFHITDRYIAIILKV